MPNIYYSIEEDFFLHKNIQVMTMFFVLNHFVTQFLKRHQTTLKIIVNAKFLVHLFFILIILSRRKKK